jgi:hypothetical protein
LQALAHHLDHRNAAGNRALEIEGNAMLLGERGERRPVMGEQRLVGGDHMLAGAECGLDRVLRGALLAADQLDEDVDLGIAGKLHWIGNETEAGNVGAAVLAPVARRHGHDLDGPADAFTKSGASLGEKSQDTASDRTETGEPEFQRLGH